MEIIYFLFAFIFIIIWAVSRFISSAKDNLDTETLIHEESVADNSEEDFFSKRILDVANNSRLAESNIGSDCEKNIFQSKKTKPNQILSDDKDIENRKKIAFSARKAVLYMAVMNPKHEAY